MSKTSTPKSYRPKPPEPTPPAALSTAAASHFIEGGMAKGAAVQVRRFRGAAVALLLAVANCAQLPPTSAVVVPPISSGAARIWFYRDYEPYETLARPLC